jgi:hypothetical protein
VTQPEPTTEPPSGSADTIATNEPPFVTYAMADGEPIWGEYSFVITLDGFEDREVRLIKRTYRLIAEEEIVLPDHPRATWSAMDD